MAPSTKGLNEPNRVFILRAKVFENTVVVNDFMILLNIFLPALLASSEYLLCFFFRNMKSVAYSGRGKTTISGEKTSK